MPSERPNRFDFPQNPTKALFKDIDYADPSSRGEAVGDFGETSMIVPSMRERTITDENHFRDGEMRSELKKKPHLRDIISGKRAAGIALTAGAAVFVVGAVGYETLRHNHHHFDALRKLLHIQKEEPTL